jgi:hypothetical protein
MRATSAVADAQMIRRQRQSLRVEIIDGDVAVRLNHNRLGVRLDRLRVDAVRKPFLDDDGVGVIIFRLRKQVANRHGLARSAHANQNRVLRGLIASGAGESFDADKILVRAFVNRLG